MITALSGTSTLRNTAINNRNESDNTPTKSNGMRPPMPSAKSTLAAVKPPTFASTPVDGMKSFRSVRMRSVVASSCGAVVG